MTPSTRNVRRELWSGPLSRFPALNLGTLQLQARLSTELEKAHCVLDEWDRDNPSQQDLQSAA